MRKTASIGVEYGGQGPTAKFPVSVSPRLVCNSAETGNGLGPRQCRHHETAEHEPAQQELDVRCKLIADPSARYEEEPIGVFAVYPSPRASGAKGSRLC